MTRFFLPDAEGRGRHATRRPRDQSSGIPQEESLIPILKRHEIKTISAHASSHGWPTVTGLQSGELVAVCSAGRERHVCPFGQVHLIRSQDSGATWSHPDALANGPLDDRDTGILQTSKGTLLVNWFTSVAWLRHLEAAEAGGREALGKLGDGFAARCQKVRAALTDKLIREELGTWLIRSTDGGRTWSEKIDCGVGSPHGPTELDDGRLLFVGNARADRFRPDAGSPYSGQLVAAQSTDDGRSWERLGTIPHREGDEGRTYHEPHAVQAADGRIIVHIRNHSAQDRGCILQSESADGGRTFSQPRNTGLLGLPAHLLALGDGRLLTTYGYRHEPYGVRASLSEDGGRTWSEPLVLDEKQGARDLGYPATVELDGGNLLSVWYEKLPDRQLASLQMARWSLA